MSLLAFGAGIAMGLAIAAPLGPVNIIVIRTALKRGLMGGLAAGAGSVVADTSFAIVAAFGLRQIADLFTRYAAPISLVGGALLVAIGVRTATRSIVPELTRGDTDSPAAPDLWRSAATTFSTTITNPGALLGVFAVFGAMADMLELHGSWVTAAEAVAGFAVGGSLWWFMLSFGIDRLRGRFSAAALSRINRWTGILVAAFGFVLLLKAAGY